MGGPGGGIIPPGGPYCMIGRYTGCCVIGVGAGFDVVSLIANIEASKI